MVKTSYTADGYGLLYGNDYGEGSVGGGVWTLAYSAPGLEQACGASVGQGHAYDSGAYDNLACKS